MTDRDAERRAQMAARAAQTRFAAKLRNLADAAAADRSTGFRLPVVDSDPGADFPTNLWGFDDGRVRWRGTDGAVHELLPGYPLLSLASNPAASSGIDIYRHSSSDELRVRRPDGTWAAYVSKAAASSGDSTQGGSTTTKPKASDPRPVKRRTTVSATWARAFNDVRGPETGWDLRYGRYDSTWGERRIMVGFDDASIRSTLAGASIRKVELSALNLDSYAHAGIEIHWGAHNVSSLPGSWSAVRRNAYVAHWPETGTGPTWRDLPLWFGRSFRDGVIRGLTIDQPFGLAYYGQIRASSIRLRITYVR